MDDRNSNDLVNNLVQNVPSGLPPSRMPIAPMPSTSVPTPRRLTIPTDIPSIPTTTAATANGNVIKIPKRYVQYMPSSGIGASIGGTYNSYPQNYPYSRPYMNMGMGGNYNSYSSYGQPMPSQYQNPAIIAAAENSRHAFDSIHSFVQSFNSMSMMLDSTFAALQMSFQAMLGMAENFDRLRMFMMKLYSAIVSFKLARWFLTKLFYLLRMVRTGRTPSAEEDLWTSLSSTNQVVPSDGRSWPLVVFSGLLVATPYFIYKLLNSVTPLPANNTNRLGGSLTLVFKALYDWSSQYPVTIPLTKGATYWSSASRLNESERNGGWLLVDTANGHKGYVPLTMLKMRNQLLRRPVVPDVSVASNIIPPTIPDQIQPQLITSPVIDMHDNPIALPHPLLDCDKLENDIHIK